jgi:hypothetical protein
MSAGADTLLLSRWRVGGQSTLDLLREFLQELPHTAADDAWQRSVQLVQETPIDPTAELRVKAGKDPVELTAKHPFFWAGYLLVDAGWRPVEAEAAVDPAAVGQPAAGQPAAPQPGAAAAPAGDPKMNPPADPKAPLPAPAPVTQPPAVPKPPEDAVIPEAPADEAVDEESPAPPIKSR